MTDLIRLAERVEALAGPDREVDLEIYRAIYPFPCVALSERAQDAFDREKAPKYTSSLDAAMTLVPDAKRPDGSTQISFPRVMRSTPDTWEAHIGYANSAKGVNAIAATPALALTASSLRSLAAQRGQG